MVVGSGSLDRFDGKNQVPAAKYPVAVAQWRADNNPVQAPDIDYLADKAQLLSHCPDPVSVLVKGKLGQQAERELLDFSEEVPVNCVKGEDVMVHPPLADEEVARLPLPVPNNCCSVKVRRMVPKIQLSHEVTTILD